MPGGSTLKFENCSEIRHGTWPVGQKRKQNRQQQQQQQRGLKKGNLLCGMRLKDSLSDPN